MKMQNAKSKMQNQERENGGERSSYISFCGTDSFRVTDYKDYTIE